MATRDRRRYPPPDDPRIVTGEAVARDPPHQHPEVVTVFTESRPAPGHIPSTHRTRVRRARSLLGVAPLLLLALVFAATPVSAATSVVYSGSREYRTIALTFDDGYYPSAVQSILDTLR